MDSSDLDNTVSLTGNSWITKYGYFGPETTELISGKKKIEDSQLVCINLVKMQLDLVWDTVTWSSRIQSPYLKNLVELSSQKARDQNIRVRMITEITKDSIPSIKALRPGFDIRHLANLKGNFEILDCRQYFVYLPNTSDDNLTHAFNMHVTTDSQKNQSHHRRS